MGRAVWLNLNACGPERAVIAIGMHFLPPQLHETGPSFSSLRCHPIVSLGLDCRNNAKKFGQILGELEERL